MRKFLLGAILLVFVYTGASAQTPIWGFGFGGPGGNNYVRASAVSANGNVVVTGVFSGTMNLNPTGTAYNITSAGGSDIFLACYTSAGALVWGFNVGGANYDGGYGITTDVNNNIFICGFFQGGANFNPLGAAYILPFAGGLGSIYQGDGFVAKYNAAGIMQWAQDLGGPTQYDYNEALATDSAGNVYVGGTYSTNMTISASITFSTATQGPGYLIKYNPAGTVVWGHAFGEFGVAAIATSIRHMVVRNGFVYSCGYFSGTADFSPWTAAVNLTAYGGAPNTNAFIAKHDTAGNLVFVEQAGGTGGDDEFEGIILDSLDNIYVAGFTNSPTVNFGGSAASTITSPGGAAAYDIMMAKYTSSGAYVWGNVFGSAAGIGRGWAIDIAGGDLFLTGQFSGTTQFDPAGSSAASFTSAGGSDIFITKYSLNDDYLCGWRVGGTTDDIGYTVSHDPATGDIYSGGQFEGTAINFEPVGTFDLTSVSTAGTDGYLVKYNPACISTTVAYSCDSLTMPDSLKVCIGSIDTMRATLNGTDSVLSYTWTPPTGLSSTTIINPVLTATTSGWYYLTVQSLMPDNLVVNGDFAAGNTGFSSTYIWSPPPSTILNEGYYSVYNNPNGVHSGFLSMTSYPVAGGNMLIINGGSTASSVWCETIAVTPNTNYDFSAWFADCSSVTVGAFVPVLQFEVNGVLLGVPTAVTAAPGTWMNFFSTWNSGTNTSATICIYDETTAANGNDFVIDDISFEPICKVTDSTYVKVTLPDTTMHVSDTSVCALTTTITLTGPAGTGDTWSTGATTTSVTVPATGTYWVSTAGNCSETVDTFKIIAVEADTNLTVEDSTFCMNGSIKLNAPTGTGYTSPIWSTGSTANAITVTDTGVYVVKENTACGEVIEEFKVTYKPLVIVSVSATVKGCYNLVNFTGSPSGIQYDYLWAGPDEFTSTVQDPEILNGTPASEGIYTLTVTDNGTGCEGKDTLTVTIKPVVPKPLTNITPTQTIDYGSSVQLNADNAIYYWWMPDNGTISNRNINNPVVDPTQTTVYTVYGMDSMGCVDSAKIEVIVLTDSIMIPSAFTPNNDGLNDVFRPLGMKYQSLVEFSVYNRWGQRVFTTNNKEVGWDGTFNGVKQDMDVYNYLLIVALDDGTNRIYKGNVTLIR